MLTDSLDILTELVGKFGGLVTSEHRTIQAVLLQLLDDGRAPIRKRAVHCLGERGGAKPFAAATWIMNLGPGPSGDERASAISAAVHSWPSTFCCLACMCCCAGVCQCASWRACSAMHALCAMDASAATHTRGPAVAAKGSHLCSALG